MRTVDHRGIPAPGWVEAGRQPPGRCDWCDEPTKTITADGITICPHCDTTRAWPPPRPQRRTDPR